MKPFLLLGGPTASGKSSLGIRLAQEFTGAVLSADAVQIYKEADIGSAKVSKEEQAVVAHYGLDLYSPECEFDAAQYCRYAQSVLEDLSRTNTQAVLVGGSTMYIKLLIEGIADLPGRDPLLRKRLESRSNTSLHRLLRRLDPDSAARLHENDRLRIVRALEILMLTGDTMGSLQEKQQATAKTYTGLLLVLWWPRQELYERINRRVQLMLDAGLLAETRYLMDRYPSAPVLRSLGYAQAKAVLEGKADEANLADAIARATRRYAKRQMTFWRNEPTKLSWQIYPDADVADGILGDDGDERLNRRGNPVKGMPVMRLDYQALRTRVRERMSKPFECCEVWHLDATHIMENE